LPFLAVDLGTSFLKGAVLDAESCQITGTLRLPFPSALPGLGEVFAEFDPRLVVETVASIIRQLAADAEIEGVLMCTQMATLVLVDADEHPLGNCIGWQDRRATLPHPSGRGSYFDLLKASISEEQSKDTGNELPAGCPASFLHWITENGSLPQGATPLGLAEFVVGQLCECVPSIHPTNAMAYGLLHLERMEWHKDLLAQFGWQQLRWPEIGRDGAIAGHMSIHGRKVPVYLPVGDFQCALAGAMLQTDELSLNISTGSQASCITANLEPGPYQRRPYFAGQFLRTISHLPGGRSMNILVNLLMEMASRTNSSGLDPWQILAEETAKCSGTDLQVKLTFFPGPLGDSGSIGNISESNLTLGSLGLACYENLAANYKIAASRVWPESSWQRVVFSGGLARKLPQLRERILSVLQSRGRLCPVAEDTLLGLLLLARVYSGRNSSLAEAEAYVNQRLQALATEGSTWRDDA
jgi:sugar (pentulose or hexulose) kinase